MASTFVLSGTYQAMPGFGMPSGDPLITAPVDERQTLELELAGQLLLTADAPVAVPFGGLTSASVFVLKVVGGPVKVRLTSSAGATQVVPCDTFLSLMSGTVPFTAITVEREPGVITTCKFFLGQRAG